MAYKRCPRCSRKHDHQIMICDCGEDLSSLQTTLETSTYRGPQGLANADAGYEWLGWGVLVFKIVAWLTLILHAGYLILTVLPVNGIVSQIWFTKLLAAPAINWLVIIISAFFNFLLWMVFSQICQILLDIRWKLATR